MPAISCCASLFASSWIADETSSELDEAVGAALATTADADIDGSDDMDVAILDEAELYAV